MLYVLKYQILIQYVLLITVSLTLKLVMNKVVVKFVYEDVRVMNVKKTCTITNLLKHYKRIIGKKNIFMQFYHNGEEIKKLSTVMEICGNKSMKMNLIF